MGTSVICYHFQLAHYIYHDVIDINLKETNSLLLIDRHVIFRKFIFSKRPHHIAPFKIYLLRTLLSKEFFFS